MTITTVAINCDIGLANNSEFTASQLEFTLSEADYDTLSNDSIPAATVVLALNASGVGTANLWPVTRGTRNSFYTVVLVGSRTINGQLRSDRFTLGRIAPPATGAPFALADLLAQSSGGIVVGSTVYATLADAVAAALAAAAAGADPIAATAAKDAAEAAQAAAELAAAQAAAFDGPWLDTVTALLNDTTLTYTAGQPTTVAAGDYVRTRAEGFSYQVASALATDFHVQTAGGVRLYVLPGEDGAVTPRQFGASPSASASINGPLLQAMFTAFSSYLIDGRYNSDQALTFGSKSVTIRGYGPQTSALIFGATNGIVYTGGTVNQSSRNTFTICDISVLTTAEGAGSAIKLSYTGGGGTSNRLVTAENVLIEATGGNSRYWLRGWDMDNVRYGSWVNCTVVGSSENQSAMLSAWRIGDSAGVNPVDNVLVSCNATFQARCVDIGDNGTGDAEGVYITGCTFIANDYAIYWDTFGNKPLLNVNGGHFASRICCIYGDGLIQQTIIGTLLYIRDETTVNFTAIDIRSSTSAAAIGTISGVVIRCNNALAVTTDGIRINQLRTLVTGCTILGADTGIIFGSDAIACRAIENSIQLPSVAPYSVAGTNNIVQDSERGGFRMQGGGVVENYFEVRPQTGANSPQLIVEGPGANIGARVRMKGTGAFEAQTGTATVFFADGLPSAANHIAVIPAIAGASPQIIARGSDTNLDLRLGAKGTGNIRFGTHVASSDVAITGYIEIKDASGVVRRLAVIS